MMKTAEPKMVIICGPTGVGKTSAALKLSREFAGEIIGADSMQVYREMDIGTAKPTLEEQSLVKHHMIDVADPDEPFDAAKYSSMADKSIEYLIKNNIVPFVVGGTGLYIKALVHGMSRARPADLEILNSLKKKCEKHGSEALHKRLARYDPIAAQKIHPNDLFRITRALEIYMSTGKTISSFHEEHDFADSKYKTLRICLNTNRDNLYSRINSRVEKMFEEGLLNEVEGLLKKGYSVDLKSMKSIGYRHVASYIENRITLEEAVETMKRDTRRYAKRQLTWFKADPELKWLSIGQLEWIMEEVNKFIS